MKSGHVNGKHWETLGNMINHGILGSLLFRHHLNACNTIPAVGGRAYIYILIYIYTYLYYIYS